MANNNHFSLTLDTLAPTGGIKRPQEYLKENMDMTITKDTSAVYMKVWFDNTEIGTKDSVGYQEAAWIPAADLYKTTFTETSGSLYYHLVLMDDVANESEVYNTEIMIYDTSAPVIKEFKLFDTTSNDTALANETTIGYSWDCEADPAPAFIVKATLTGSDIETTEVEISSGATTGTGTITFKAGTEDGSKTITLTLTDAAGNVSTAKTATITLDTKLDVPVLTVANNAGQTVGEWVNYHDVKVTLRSNDEKIIGYKIWEGTEEPTDWTTQEAGTLLVTQDVTLSEGDGEKVLHAKVKDAALNIAEASAITIKIDTVAPETTFTVDKTLISNVEDYTEASLTMTASDEYSGITSYQIILNDKETVASGTTVPAEGCTITSANGLVEGANKIAFIVTDNANNTTTKEVTVTLDTTAPANVTINQLEPWYNDNFKIQITYEDAHIGNGKGEIIAWVSNINSDTTAPADVAKVMPTASPQDIAADNIGGTKKQSATNYLHIKVTDAVGNVSYAHEQFGFDNVRPIIEEVKFSKTAYSSPAASISIRYSDETSGVTQMQVTGDLTNGQDTNTWVEAAETYGVTLTSETDGDKTIYVKVKDAAGNITETAVSATCELDQTAPGVTATLFEADGTTVKPNHSPLDTIAIKIAVTDDDAKECQYQVYGAVTKTKGSETGITKNDENWVDYVETNGQKFVMLTDYYATGNDGTKEIYVVVRDNAGNETEAAKMSFVLDTAAPTVVISGPDYNRISKVNVLRRNSEGTIAGKFADEVTFTFTPDSFIQAYKVCAYVDQAAAEKGNPTIDAAIGNINGSVNMSATGLTSNAEVTAKLKGADYEAALGTITNAGDLDGLHYVVVYVQDYAGTWSVAADFTV